MDIADKLQEQFNFVRSKRQTDHGVCYKKIKRLLDSDSFVEMGALSDGDNVITGYGTINSRLVYVFCQNGSINLLHAKKIKNVYKYALKMGAPIVAMLNSDGADVENGLEVLDSYGQIFSCMSKASGKVPQICYIYGKCMGSSAFMAGLSDFNFMLNKESKLFLESPNVYADIKSLNPESLSGAEFHSKNSGLSHFSYNTEDECINGIKELLNYLPSNNGEDKLYETPDDDLNRTDQQLNSLIAIDENESIDIKSIISSISDNGKYIEQQEGFGQSMVTYFSKLGGHTAGILANNGPITVAGLQKASRFITLCDSFNIPIVTITDAKSYENSSKTDGEIIYNGSQLIKKLTCLNVPKINIIVRNGIGSPYLIMNSKHLGADVVYAWPNAAIAAMPPEAGRKMLGLEIESSPIEAAILTFADDIIEPSLTRKRIIISLEMLYSKN